MYDTTHLHALELRLSNERMRLFKATNPVEIELRSVWVQQAEKEIKGEIEFLASKGITVQQASVGDIDPDALLKELLG
jgi:hypothetical protein